MKKFKCYAADIVLYYRAVEEACSLGSLLFKDWTEAACGSKYILDLNSA